MTHGYTLLELLVAITIIALVAGAVGGLQNGRNQERRADADMSAVRQFLISAQAEARRIGQAVSVVATSDHHGLVAGALDVGPFGSIVAADSVSFDSIGFTNGGRIRLTLDEEQRVVEVEPLTGRVFEAGRP